MFRFRRYRPLEMRYRPNRPFAGPCFFLLWEEGPVDHELIRSDLVESFPIDSSCPDLRPSQVPDRAEKRMRPINPSSKAGDWKNFQP